MKQLIFPQKLEELDQVDGNDMELSIMEERV
jgi:hypothetical protein